MLDKPIYKFKIDASNEIAINLPKGVFVPTGTSAVLFRAIRGYIHEPKKVLDLGCGCGVVGIALHQVGLSRPPLFASDLSEQAVGCTKENAVLYNCPVVIKCGSLFKPWGHNKFDIIVNDVSGIAEEVAKISPWFGNVSCQAGVDGTTLVIKVIQDAKKHLNPGGKLFFPIVSFSSVDSILNAARENYLHVKRLAHQKWPLPKEMHQHLSVLRRLQEGGHVQFVEKFGMILWFTDVYVTYNS